MKILDTFGFFPLCFGLPTNKVVSLFFLSNWAVLLG